MYTFVQRWEETTVDHHGRVVGDLRFQRLEALKNWWFGGFMWRIFRFQPLVCRGVWKTNPKCPCFLHPKVDLQNKMVWCFHSFTQGLFFQKRRRFKDYRIIYRVLYKHPRWLVLGRISSTGHLPAVSFNTGRRLVFAPQGGRGICSQGRGGMEPWDFFAEFPGSRNDRCTLIFTGICVWCIFLHGWFSW